VKAQIDDMAGEIERLSAKAEKTGGRVKADIDRQVADLKEQQERAMDKLKKLSLAGGGAAEELKAGMDLAIADMANALARAREKFRDL